MSTPPMIGAGKRPARTDRIATLSATVLTAAAFLFAWWHDPRRPASSSLADGWWTNYDQNRYIRSALALSHLDFSPAQHWYLPAYPALAALFARLLPADPFMPVDLVCLLASLWLTVSLAAALAPDCRWARLAGLASFIACAVLPPVCLSAWVIPWSSTLAAPLMLGSLRATLAGLSNGSRRLPPLIAGFAGAAVGGCRPVDAVLLLACVGLAGGWSVVATGGFVRATRWLTLFAAGIVAGALPTLLLFLLIWGPHQSPYMISSGLVGFEPRLLGLHWVELMISPRPLIPGGEGLAQRLPFIGLGLLGVMAALLAHRPGRLRHALAAAAIAGSFALYLSYRDLHAPGLWTYGNYHYFKWSFGLFGFYTVMLAELALRTHRTRLLWLLPIPMLLFCWRVAPHPAGGAPGVRLDDRSFRIAIPRLGVQDAVVAPATGAFEPIYFGSHAITVSGRSIPPISTFKSLPIEGGLMLTPLRPWPGGDLVVHLVDGVTLEPQPAPFLARLDLRFGLPCWFGWRQSDCTADTLLPPPLIPPNVADSLTGDDPPLFGPGWSYGEPGGRWTLGSQAELRFRIGPDRGLPILVTLSGSPIWRPGMGPATVRIGTDREPSVRRTLPDGSTTDISVRIPPVARAPGGVVDLWIGIDAPHPPSAVFPGSRDTRPLGLFVRSVRWRYLDR